MASRSRDTAPAISESAVTTFRVPLGVVEGSFALRAMCRFSSGVLRSSATNTPYSRETGSFTIEGGADTFVRDPLPSLEQLPRSRPKSISQPHDHPHPRIATRRLDATDLSRAHASKLRECVLRQAALLAEAPKVSTELDEWVAHVRGVRCGCDDTQD